VEDVKAYWTKTRHSEAVHAEAGVEGMTYDEVVDGEDKKRDQEMELFRVSLSS
jgi:hypothetical protein